eukprot:15458155-Alexandrium_andersonii.AAC.1
MAGTSPRELLHKQESRTVSSCGIKRAGVACLRRASWRRVLVPCGDGSEWSSSVKARLSAIGRGGGHILQWVPPNHASPEWSDARAIQGLKTATPDAACSV